MTRHSRQTRTCYFGIPATAFTSRRSAAHASGGGSHLAPNGRSTCSPTWARFFLTTRRFRVPAPARLQSVQLHQTVPHYALTVSSRSSSTLGLCHHGHAWVRRIPWRQLQQRPPAQGYEHRILSAIRRSLHRHPWLLRQLKDGAACPHENPASEWTAYRKSSRRHRMPGAAQPRIACDCPA